MEGGVGAASGDESGGRGGRGGVGGGLGLGLREADDLDGDLDVVNKGKLGLRRKMRLVRDHKSENDDEHGLTSNTLPART